jgi:hypothetical protein
MLVLSSFFTAHQQTRQDTVVIPGQSRRCNLHVVEEVSLPLLSNQLEL